MKAFPEDLEQALEELDRLAREGTPCAPPPVFIAIFVRSQRVLRGWKQGTLASFARVSLSTVQRIERSEPVSSKSLEQVAVALGLKPGAFVEPRAPLTFDKLGQKLEEIASSFEGLTPVSVRPLRGQQQVAKLARCHFYLINGDMLGNICQNDMATLTEHLDFVAFVLETEREKAPTALSWEGPTKRRELYSMVLDHVRDIERRYGAVALAGTYQVETREKIMPVADVATIVFFSRSSDPGAVKRRELLAPAIMDLAAVWGRWCDSPSD